MTNFAVIETGGKQYIVSPGQKIRVEKIEKKLGEVVNFDKVLLRADGSELAIGTPYLQGKQVQAKVLRQGRERKKIVFKYHSKTRYKKKKGHRQHYTELEIVKL